jgi:ABC-type nitrate/sulfonate/bicarbonate transport system permease component
MRRAALNRAVPRPHEAARRPHAPARLRIVSYVLGRLWIPIVALVLWEVATRHFDNLYFPSPSAIARTMHEQWFSGPIDHVFLTTEAIGTIFPSLARMFGGWLLAAVCGITLGVALGRSRNALDYADPLLHFGRTLPPPALIPLFIALFKIGTTMQVATIVFGVIWPILINSIEGARRVNQVQIDTARVFCVTGLRRLFFLILPSAAPKIVAGLRLSLSISLILMVVSELIGSTNGIGFQMQNAQREFDFPVMWSCIVLLGALGYLLNVTLISLERRLLLGRTPQGQ